MKVSRIALLVAAVVALGLAPLAHAQGQKGMENVMTMDTDKDGMISKAEFMRMMEARFDAMDKNKTGKLTPQQVQQVIDSIGKQFGYAQ